MEIVACTVVARNYLPAARVLARSFREHHPNARFEVLVVDDLKREVEEGREPFGVIRLDDIGIEHDEVLQMAAIYDVMELCTAVKAWLLNSLLHDGANVAIYLDPDIKVYGSLEEVIEGALGPGIVLTPHATRPMPRDSLSKSEAEILLSGIYNLGFIAVSPLAYEFLSFWQERLRRDCIVDPANMLFVDQRWVDFVPGMWPAHIIHDPTYNVAYWNLDHRELSFEDGQYLVDGLPLHFFHFSGYSPDYPYILSKHQGNKPRILLSEHPAVARICDEYGAELLASGYRSDAKVEYGYGRLANGLVLDKYMRRLYREALVKAELHGAEPPPNPLELNNYDRFLSWLVEPAETAPEPRLSRYLGALHAGRGDLQGAFPDPTGANFEAFVSWARQEVQEGGLDPRLVTVRLAQADDQLRSLPPFEPVPVEDSFEAVPPGPSAEGVRSSTSELLTQAGRRLMANPSVTSTAVDRQQPRAGCALLPGIRVAGYLRTESGVGELGRLALAAVQRARIQSCVYVDTTALSRQGYVYESSGEDLNVNLICVNADELPNFAQRVGRQFFEDHYTIGLWAWELEEFPDSFSHSFSFLDEIWSISSFSQRAIARRTTKPVYSFPLPIVEPSVKEGVTRAQLGLDDRFTFLFCFDFLSIFERKNPLGTIDAFCKAFGPGEGPVLVIKVVNGDLDKINLERLRFAVGSRPDISIMDGYLEPEVNAALMASCDCYVSLHRSEGFGLTLAEALALGKPVVATGYSGNLDFMTPETSYLVPWRPGRVPSGCGPYPEGARWAEPDLDAAAQILRQVYEAPSQAAEVGRRAREHVLNKHGLDVRAAFLSERFESAQSLLLERSSRSRVADMPETAGPTEVPEASGPGPVVALARQPRDLNAPSNHPRAARLFRRIVWRALRSHDDHDREIHVGLADAVENVTVRLTQVREALERVQSQYGRSASTLRADLLAQKQAAQGDRARIDEIVRRLDREGARVDEHRARLNEVATRLDDQGALVNEHNARLDEVAARLDSQGERLDNLEEPGRLERIDKALSTSEELRAVPFMSNPELLITTDEEGRPAIGYRDGVNFAAGYVSFEDLFRGPEEMIRDRFAPYMRVLAGHEPVVDIGCGRGELLDLLAKAGITAIGVDMDLSMVERVRAKGHEVVQQDAIEYLSAQLEDSLGAVFSAQVIEHLPLEAISPLLKESYRALRPGGVMVHETVNPYSVQAFRAFWTDITHRHPIHPEALLVYCAQAGFSEALVTFPLGSGDLSKDRWSEGEYAVIARKAYKNGDSEESFHQS